MRSEAAREFEAAKDAIDAAQERGVSPESDEGLQLHEAAHDAFQRAPWYARHWR